MKNEKDKPVTSTDVARLAGVSPASVTRVFNPNWEMNVRPDIKGKVLEAAQRLGYSPNAFARMLAAKKSNLIAVVLGPETGYYYSQVLIQFIYKMRMHGKQVLPFTTDGSTSNEVLLRRIEQFRVDAIIMTSVACNMLYEPLETDIPILLFEREINGIAAHSICSDSYSGGRQVADMLLDNGHKKIAFISGNGQEIKDFNREYGFVGRMCDRGAPIWRSEIAGYAQYSSGCVATRRLMMGNAYPDSIFCADDVLAMAAVDVLRHEFMVKVPEDISVVGFHNIREAALPAYSLTTMRSPVNEMVEAALDFVDRMDVDDPHELYQKQFPMTPILRNSMRVTDQKYAILREENLRNEGYGIASDICR